jgi:hypothetical protein
MPKPEVLRNGRQTKVQIPKTALAMTRAARPVPTALVYMIHLL